MPDYVRELSANSFDPWQGKIYLLKSLDIELTERCNNRCIHCYINRPENDTGAINQEMSSDRVKDILREAADLGCVSVRFTGGEPLLRSDFSDLYLFARRLGMFVPIITNARLITPQIANLFSEVPPGVPIEVSVYGMSSDTYDSVSGVKGAYWDFRKGVDLLLDCQVPFVVRYVVLPQNKKDIGEYDQWAKTIPWMQSKPAYVWNFNLRARRDDDYKNDRIRANRIQPSEMLELLGRDPSTIQSLKEFCKCGIGPAGDKLFPCGAGIAICIDSYGKAQMCLSLRDPDTVYDLEQGSLGEALRTFFPQMKKRKAIDPGYLGRCAHCFLKGLCEQCPANSWMEHGTLDTPVEYLCEVAHAQAQWLGLLKENEKAWEIDDWRKRLSDL